MHNQALDASGTQDWPGRSTVSFLLNAGLLGIELKRFDDARELLAALQTLCPNLPHVQLALVYLESRAVGVLEARHELLRILEGFPSFQMGAAMLALLDREAQFSGWQGLAESVVQDGSDEPAMKLAQYVLGRKRIGSDMALSGPALPTLSTT